MKKNKKDILENFVDANRSDFDSLEPSNAVWDAIDKRLNTVTEQPSQGGSASVKPLRHYGMYWRMIAMLILGIGIGYLFFLNKEYGFTKDPQLALTAPTYAREFTRYASLIEQKREDLYVLAKENPEVYEDSAYELEQLELNYQRLRKELTKIPNQEELIQAMIQNLQWQIDILNQQLTIINKVKSNEANKQTYL